MWGEGEHIMTIAHQGGAKPYAKRGWLQGKSSTMQSVHLHAYACASSIPKVYNFKPIFRKYKKQTTFKGSYVALSMSNKNREELKNPPFTNKEL